MASHLVGSRFIFAICAAHFTRAFPHVPFRYDFQCTLARHPVSLKPPAASPTVLPLACAGRAEMRRSSSWQNRVALRVADGRPRRAKTWCVSRTFTNAQRVIGHTDAWCEAASARKGAL